MDKIAVKLTSKEWQQLTGIVLRQSAGSREIGDKYVRAMFQPLLKQVYIKLHNKLHSLKAKNNALNLSLPEASALGQALQESSDSGILVLEVIRVIDQKLT